MTNFGLDTLSQRCVLKCFKVFLSLSKSNCKYDHNDADNSSDGHFDANALLHLEVSCSSGFLRLV